MSSIKKRIWYNNAMYHNTIRGNRKEDIFKDKNDYKKYLFLMQEAREYYDNKFFIVSYCLMTNHVHLHIKTTDIHISNFMKRLNERYARYFNSKYGFTGHVFQRRYYSKLIEDDKYNVDVSRYIHRNPVRANIVEKPEDYVWSSYRMYIGEEETEIISPEYVMCLFPDNDKELYKQYVESVISSTEI